jgi:hypothetical protein
VIETPKEILKEETKVEFIPTVSTKETKVIKEKIQKRAKVA